MHAGDKVRRTHKVQRNTHEFLNSFPKLGSVNYLSYFLNLSCLSGASANYRASTFRTHFSLYLLLNKAVSSSKPVVRVSFWIASGGEGFQPWSRAAVTKTPTTTASLATECDEQRHPAKKADSLCAPPPFFPPGGHWRYCGNNKLWTVWFAQTGVIVKWSLPFPMHFREPLCRLNLFLVLWFIL